MLSIEVHRWLTAVEAGAAVDPEALATLLARNWVERVQTTADPQRLNELRAELRGVQAIRADAAGDPARRAILDEATRRERELRTAILDLSEASARGDRPLALTWRGRELHGELGPRLGRLDGMDVDAFEARMRRVALDLTALAGKARALLPAIDRSGGAGVSPVTLRSVALGLAAFSASADPVASWTAALTALPRVELPPDVRATLAEALVGHHPHGLPGAVDAAWRQIGGQTPDDTAAVLAVLGMGPELTDRLREARALGDALPALDAVGASLLAAGGSASISADRTLLDEASRIAGATVGALPTATRGRVIALLALAPGDGEVPLARFHGIRRWLAGFVADDAAMSAATLTVLWAGHEEILDDLRIAAEVVDREKLGTGGLGSLALGARLLLLASGTLPGGLLPQVTVGRGSIQPRQLLQASGTFHHDSLHRAALLAWHAERARQLHAHHHGG